MSEIITEEMYYRMCDCNMSDPIPLNEADLNIPFVYERRFGVFYVAGGYHPSAMSLLLSWQYNLNDGIDVAELLKLSYSYGTSDHWFENTPGAAYRSSVGKNIYISSFKNMTIQERRLFHDAKVL